MGGALAFIILVEPPAKTMRFDADERVPLLIEIGGPAECFDGDVVLFYLIGLPFEILGTDVAKHVRQTGRTAEDSRGEHCLKFSLFLTQPHRGRHKLNR